jgi:hypothetical protein
VDVTVDILLVLSNVSSRVSRYRLRDDQFISWNLRGLLECGVQKSMDTEEPRGPVDPSAPPLAIEMSAKGAHTMMAPLKDDVQELNDTVANLSNQLESVRVEDVTWCQSRILTLEKPNNPANRSLWLLINQLSCRVEDQQDLITDLKAGMTGMRERVGVLEMSSAMIRSRVSIIEDAMEIDPPVTDLSEEDLTDSEYADMDDGGAMLVEDSEEERENMALPPPPVIWVSTPHPAPVLRELIPIKDLAPLAPGIEVEGKDDAWYIPPTMCRRIHAIDEFSVHRVDPLPEYVEELRNNPLAGPPREDLAADGSEDEMWAALGVVHRSTNLIAPSPCCI